MNNNCRLADDAGICAEYNGCNVKQVYYGSMESGNYLCVSVHVDFPELEEDGANAIVRAKIGREGTEEAGKRINDYLSDPLNLTALRDAIICDQFKGSREPFAQVFLRLDPEM